MDWLGTRWRAKIAVTNFLIDGFIDVALDSDMLQFSKACALSAVVHFPGNTTSYVKDIDGNKLVRKTVIFSCIA